jgi:hypothetical protein
MEKLRPKSLSGSIFVTKRELLYLCNTGQLRVLADRVCEDSSDSDRLFSVGLSTSPLDVDNCCVVKFEVINFTDQVDKSAVRKDLFWLEACDVLTIAPIKRLDADSLMDLVNEKYRSLFVEPIEDRWQSWLQRESVRIHRRSFERLLEWSGQKKMTKAESNSPRIEALLAVAIGQKSPAKAGEKDLSMRFLGAIKHISEDVGAGVGTVTSAFGVMDVWEKLVEIEATTNLETSWEKLRKVLSKRAGEVLSIESLERGGLLSKLRKRQRSASGAYSKEVQPLMMSFCLRANYRIIGGVFGRDDFLEALRVLQKFEKDKAAWLYTLFVASQMEPEVVYLQTSGGMAGVPAELSSPQAE